MLWPAYCKRHNSVWFVHQTCQIIGASCSHHIISQWPLWGYALQIRAICDYGITESEMKRYMDAMLKEMRHEPQVDIYRSQHVGGLIANCRRTCRRVCKRMTRCPQKFFTRQRCSLC